MPEWTTLKRMIWLLLLRGASAVIRTITGTSPLVLENAIAAAIKSLKQYGKCTQASTPTPDAPVDILCNNGALRMLNLANMAESNLDIGYYLNNSGVRTQSLPNFYTLGFIPVKASTTYTKKTSASLNYFSIMEYDSAQGFLSRTLWGSSSSPAGDTTTFTTRSDTAYLRFGSNMNGNTLTYADISAVTWMLTEGETAQDYVPYGQLSVVGTPEVLTLVCNHASGGLTGKGTYVSPTTTASNRAYKRLDVPNGTYTFAVDGDYELIVQWRDPADPSVTAQGYENLSGWITSGEVTLDKTSGGYGITVRRTSGTSITPDTFDGTLYCFKTSDIQTVTDIPMLLSVGNYADEGEIISGLLTHKVGIKVLDGTESGWALSDSGSTHRFRGVKPSDCHTPASRAPGVCTHFVYISVGQTLGGMFIGASQYWYFIPTDQTIDTVDKWTAWLAAQYAAGTPVIVLYPLATETTEQTTAHNLHTTVGDNVVDVVSNVDPVELEIEYSASA